MRTITILLLAAILIHQILLPRVNSILLMEILGFIIFCAVGFPWHREFKRSKERRRHLREVERKYLSKTEPKTWRGRTQTEVMIEKNDLFDRI